MTDITEIARLLAARAQSVAEYLLPRGHKEGLEWRAGSTAGEPGDSLGVHLAGPKAGIWADFADTDRSGDLIDLWRIVRGTSLPQALIEAREWLGVALPKPSREPKKNYARPAKPSCRMPQARVRDYLREERNIATEVISRYHIGEDGNDIVFPFLLPDGTLALAKRRKAEAGAKTIPTAGNCEPVLFGWQAIDPNAREVVLTEGEIDALSWASYGFAAMSVPFGGGGGGKQAWIESDFERMDRFEKIYLSMDMDKPGDEAALEIAERLGRHRCLRVRLPKKDANECLVGGVSLEAMTECLAQATTLDPEGLRRPSEFADAVVRLFWPDEGARIGYRTPYKKLGDNLVFRPGEVSLWSGSTAAGKSQILSDCIVDWIEQESRVCLCSFEMRPEETLKRMCRQVVGVRRPTEEAIRRALAWLDRGLLLYDRLGKERVKSLISVFDFARGKYGCDQFVIDSLMRLGINSDDYVGQEQAMFELVTWALARNVHVHLVAHARKGEKDGMMQGSEDIKGTMEIGANAFNIIILWRNRKLEELIKAAKDDEEREKLSEKPTVLLNVSKQRNGDFEGKIGLWFDIDSYQYQSSHDRSAWKRNYIRHSDIEAGFV